MKNMLKITCFLILLSAYNCVPAKGANSKDTSNAQTEAQQTTDKQMKDKGFSKGTIATSKSSGCPYILNVEEFKDNLDPINLEEFFKDQMPTKVWVKYGSLRRPSRCNDARPVSIIEINKRTE
ncbi:hypothetical protein D1816_17635 [Aquimarina sp. AD10]|uniref:hypothetical protein n=1 Tax=Aquimarina sp. AD10 TaxID=1714849 RepID=UPI000E5349EE|nr:hypothetical protein [Aquimarina sp. AD10]AXT62102.1 hypothetical protein D1816_17635 [Aquimarina sp. AD10]RKM99910.1 hypothetical protein D7033_09945 [Aquimarina sp. AD10]